MITLNSTTDSIQVILDSSVTTNQLNCVSIYRDTTTTGITPSSNVTLTNDTTTVNLVSSPSSSVSRLVEYISVYNSDTNGAFVTIRFSDNGTYYTLFRTILSVGDKLEYSDKSGFKVITNTGSVRNITNSLIPQFINTGLSIVSLPNDVTVNTYATMPQTIVGFGFPTNPGKRYYFKFILFFDVDATTTGTRWNINYPVWSTFISQQSWISLTTTSASVLYGLSSPLSPATFTATSPSTSGNYAYIEGFIFAENYEFIDINVSSEVASPAFVTLKAGSILMYNEVY
jgi:hypothetical protein